eukprot:876829-Lingulodinium_polyedra.AAC.1
MPLDIGRACPNGLSQQGNSCPDVRPPCRRRTALQGRVGWDAQGAVVPLVAHLEADAPRVLEHCRD